ncbi:fumarate hydratase [bacterium]|nr:fumarate hydratase [bacterium]
MREISTEAIKTGIMHALKEIHFQIRPDVKAALQKALDEEASPLGRQALELLLENAKMASAGIHPLCQDTGLTIIFAEVGQEVAITGGALNDAIQAGVRAATQEVRLRHSISVHPFKRVNTGDNTPAVVHYHIVPGKGCKLHVMAKGGGSENASAMAMLLPSAGTHGVMDFVVDRIRRTGAAACPPLIIGVGVGGSFDTAPLLAKKALLRKVGEPSLDVETANLEKKLLERINQQGIGPQGWGGTVTALSVAVETAPCHIASMPVALNVECHSHRLAEVKL